MSQLGIKSNTINSTLDTPITQGIKNEADSEIMKPRADLPPELQNARPSKRGILARIGAFLFGAGAAGGAAFGLGAGGLVGGLIGVGATAAVGIATGGAALIGGAVALGLFAGIKALVNHFRRAPDPLPRIQNMTVKQDTPVNPEVKAFNDDIANRLRTCQMLPTAIEDAGYKVMEKLHAANYSPEAILGDKLNDFADEVSRLTEKLTPEKYEEMLCRYTGLKYEKPKQSNLISEKSDSVSQASILAKTPKGGNEENIKDVKGENQIDGNGSKSEFMKLPPAYRDAGNTLWEDANEDYFGYLDKSISLEEYCRRNPDLPGLAELMKKAGSTPPKITVDEFSERMKGIVTQEAKVGVLAERIGEALKKNLTDATGMNLRDLARGLLQTMKVKNQRHFDAFMNAKNAKETGSAIFTMNNAVMKKFMQFMDEVGLAGRIESMCRSLARYGIGKEEARKLPMMKDFENEMLAFCKEAWKGDPLGYNYAMDDKTWQTMRDEMREIESKYVKRYTDSVKQPVA